MQPNTYYHIYNHANGNEDLFRTEDNYNYFLKRYAHFIVPIADTYAYCLMPNHFHFLIQIKEEDVLNKAIRESNNNMIELDKLSGHISQQFSNLFNSYAKAYNKMYKRKGSLFNRPFKKKEVETDVFFTKLIHYILANPVHHGFVNSIKDWQFSSYLSILSNHSTLLNRKEVLEWFNGIDDFVKIHNQAVDLKIKDSN